MITTPHHLRIFLIIGVFSIILNFHSQAQEVLTKTNGGASWETPTVLVVRAVRTSTQTIASSTTTDVTYDVEAFDLGNHFDPSTGVLTTDEAGYYLISASIVWDGSNTTSASRSIRILKNGSTILDQSSEIGSGQMTESLSVTVYSDGNDDFRIQGWQDSGSSHGIGGTVSAPNTTFSAYKIR